MSDWLASWFAEMSTAAAETVDLPEEFSAEKVVVSQVLKTEGGPDAAWTLRVEAGRATVEAGRAPDAQAVFHTDHDTARSLAEGSLSVGQALSLGKVTASGDVASLVRAQHLLAEVRTALASSRARGSSPPPG